MTGSLSQRLSVVAPSDRHAVVLAEVCSVVASMLDDNAAVDPDRPFHDYGYSSLAAVEFTRRLSTVAGVELPAVLLFDHPTPGAVARYLLARTEPDPPGEPGVERHSAAPEQHDPAGWSQEPIAIVGMACRYPGDVRSPEDLWRLVASGTDAISDFPGDRGWDPDTLYHPDPDHPRTTYVRSGGFLRDTDRFDAEFFRISPREARAMDPQQRLLLEGAWESFEHAGLAVSALSGTDTGVFAGVCGSDYAWLAQSGADEVEGYWGTGTAGSVASGRIAYTFGLEGPAITIDTACSSSLVALHLAARSLRAGECSLALAGGVTVMTTPNMWLEFGKHRAMSPDGRCRSFAQGANGTAWAEGMGMVLLERLSDARRNGRRILAVLRGSAVNQDGASNGLTAPRGGAQEQVIRRALADAGLTGADVDALEAHGTGTPLGDSIEAGAILGTYGRGRSPQRPLWLGSLKSNIGHAQAAAGVGGLIKMILALRHGLLPRTLHAETPTGTVDWTSGAVALLTESVEWVPGERPRRAGISAFGVGGTNAHVIIEEAPAAAEETPLPASPTAWVLSAHTAEALADRRRALIEFVGSRRDLDPGAVAVALSARDHAMRHRSVVVGSDLAELRARLLRPQPGTTGETGAAEIARAGKIAFVFSGQGSQWQGMAVELLDSYPVFAQAFHACAKELATHLDWTPDTAEAVIRGAAGAPSLDRVDVVQPVLFAVMVSTAALWRSYGLEPDVVIGHSQGEIAAACIAGGLSLSDAATIVASRAKAIAGLPRGGGMISISHSAAAATRLAEQHSGVSVAAVNGPESVVLAGGVDALREILADCGRAGVRAKLLPVDYASHSPQVEVLKSDLARSLSGIEPRTGQITFCSSTTAKTVDTAELDARYWYRNLRSTVRFDAAVRGLLDQGVRTFVEMSPHPVLIQSIAAIADATGTDRVIVAGSTTRQDGSAQEFLRSVAGLYLDGVDIDWRTALRTPGSLGPDLPPYPFQRTRCWIPPGKAAASAQFGFTPVDHPLLDGELRVGAQEGTLWTGTWSLPLLPWLADHRVCGVVIVPGTAFVELAAYAAASCGLGEIAELHLETPLRLFEDEGVRVQLWLGAPEEDGRRPVAVHSRRADSEAGEESSWVRHAAGVLAPTSATGAPDVSADSWPPAQAAPMDTSPMYAGLAREGLEYGPSFRNVRQAWSVDDELYVEVTLPETESSASYALAHPALLDSAFHIALDYRDDDRPLDEVWIPFSWNGVRLNPGAASPDALRVRIRRTAERAVTMSANDRSGDPALSVGSVALRSIPVAALRRESSAGGEPFHLLRWIDTALPDPSGAEGHWAVLAGDSANAAPGWATTVADLGELITAMDHGAPVPEVVVAPLDTTGERLSATRVRAVLHRTLALLQQWLAESRLRESRLVLLTRGAVADDAVTGGSARPEAVSLDGAALWGLAGSAQSENPGQFVLVDSDDPAPFSLLPQIVGLGEPRVRVREGRVSVARLFADRRRPAAFAVDPESTVLITGGVSGIGAAVARHLVARGARHLLLISRQGASAPAAADLAAELRAAGATVTVAAADVADAHAMRAVLASVPAEHPLAGVVHSAGVLDDGVVTALTGHRLDTVLRPKIDGALVLHTLTEAAELRFFVLMSSIAGVIGSGGQGNYAAANAYLDALASHRRAQGLAATSIAWGLWDDATAMTGHLLDDGVSRLAERGLAPLRTEDALDMFDTAVEHPAPAVVAAALNRPALSTLRADGVLPPLFEPLLPQRATPRAEHGPGLRDLLATHPDAQWQAEVGRVVAREAAAVLRYAADRALPRDRSFKELGLDSLGALLIRNRLNAATGLALPVSMVFDHPTVDSLAEYVTGQLRDHQRDSRVAAVEAAVGTLRDMLTELPEDSRAQVLEQLTGLMIAPAASVTPERESSTIESASASELFDIIDHDLGVH